MTVSSKPVPLGLRRAARPWALSDRHYRWIMLLPAIGVVFALTLFASATLLFWRPSPRPSLPSPGELKNSITAAWSRTRAYCKEITAAPGAVASTTIRVPAGRRTGSRNQ